MDSPSHGFIFSTIFMLLIFHSRAANTPSKLVQDICNGVASYPATKYADCVDALELDPRTASADLSTLAKISIQLGISKAKSTYNFIDNMLKNNTNLQKPLKVCLFWYEAAVGSFGSALKELEEDILTANYDVKIAGDDVNECENELARDKAQIPQLTRKNNDVKLYSYIASVITDRL